MGCEAVQSGRSLPVLTYCAIETWLHFFGYLSTQKMETVHSTETSVELYRTHGVTSQMVVLLIV
jgi:hypothetical protein